MITLDRLDRGVPAAPDDQRGLGADQAGSVDEQVERGEVSGLGVVPARAHRGFTISRVPRGAWLRKASGRRARGTRPRPRVRLAFLLSPAWTGAARPPSAASGPEEPGGDERQPGEEDDEQDPQAEEGEIGKHGTDPPSKRE